MLYFDKDCPAMGGEYGWAGLSATGQKETRSPRYISCEQREVITAREYEVISAGSLVRPYYPAETRCQKVAVNIGDKVWVETGA